MGPEDRYRDSESPWVPQAPQDIAAYFEALPRHRPLTAIRLWHALDAWRFHLIYEPDLFDRWTAAPTADAVREFRRRVPLPDCGAIAGGIQTDSAPYACSFMRGLRKHLEPTGDLCLQALLNLKADDPATLLAVADLWLAEKHDDRAEYVVTTRGQEHRRLRSPATEHARQKKRSHYDLEDHLAGPYADLPRPGLVPADIAGRLRWDIGLLRKLVYQLEALPPCKAQDTYRRGVELTDVEAQRFRQLFRLGAEASGDRSKVKVPLYETPALLTSLIAIDPQRPPDKPHLFRRKGRQKASWAVSSWFHGVGEPERLLFTENWIVARAAAFLFTYVTHGVGAHFGKCSRCGCHWVESPGGAYARKCIECTALRSESTTDKAIWEEAGQHYVVYDGYRYFLDLAASGIKAERRAGKKNTGLKCDIAGYRRVLIEDHELTISRIEQNPVRQSPR